MAPRRSDYACENCYRLKSRCTITSGTQCKQCLEKKMECLPRLKRQRRRLDGGLQETDNLESVFIEPHRWSCFFQDSRSTTLDYYASVSLVKTYLSLGILHPPTGFKWVLMALYRRVVLENAVHLLHSITTLALKANISLAPVLGCCKGLHQQQDHHHELYRRLDEFGGPCVLLSLNMGQHVLAANEQYHNLFESTTSLSHRIKHSRDWWTQFIVDEGFINGIASDCFASFFLNARTSFYNGGKQRVDWEYISHESTLLRDQHNRFHRVFIAIQISVSSFGESLYVLYGFIFANSTTHVPNEVLPVIPQASTQSVSPNNMNQSNEHDKLESMIRQLEQVQEEVRLPKKTHAPDACFLEDGKTVQVSGRGLEPQDRQVDEVEGKEEE